MNLHEYQGKSILVKYGVPIQNGYAADSVEEAMTKYDQLVNETGSGFAVIKAQIHAGGRGKGGGGKAGEKPQRGTGAHLQHSRHAVEDPTDAREAWRGPVNR